LIVPVQTTATLPTEGMGQTWDYSSWVADHRSNYPYVGATSDPVFVDALNYEAQNLVFAGMTISTREYEAVDNNGWYLYGRDIDPVSYSLTAVSGGASDSLHFLDYSDIYGGRIDMIPFPATYQTQRSQSRQETIPFEITIAAFGLNKTPGFHKKNYSRELEVVGSGTLVMPTSLGTASASFDVLLVKSNRTLVDSFFLGGVPASATLLGALGLTQGSISRDSFYNFYAPNFGANILGMTDNGGTGHILFYKTQAIDAVLAITDIEVTNPSNCFPNPVQQQQTLTIQTNKNIGSANLTIVDVNGRVVFQKFLDNIQYTKYQWSLPANLGQGIYFYQLIDKASKHQTQGQFQVH
ncbi:MAG: T9SS type A sorting domain-containing protein, partial [Aureispira sp.]|nr:T9SS type A sorting domain-containing protein [Aureispira sp.]